MEVNMERQRAVEQDCPRCKLCGTALSPQSRAKICLHHRLDSARFAELFWDEA